MATAKLAVVSPVTLPESALRMPPLADNALYELTRNGTEWSFEPVGRVLVAEWWEIHWVKGKQRVPLSRLGQAAPAQWASADDAREAKRLERNRYHRIIHVRRYRRIK